MQLAIERNPDHLIYAYTFDPSDPDVIHAFQLYSTAEAAASFLTTDPYLAEVDGLLIDTEVTVGDEVWHKPNHD